MIEFGMGVLVGFMIGYGFVFYLQDRWWKEYKGELRAISNRWDEPGGSSEE